MSVRATALFKSALVEVGSLEDLTPEEFLKAMFLCDDVLAKAKNRGMNPGAPKPSALRDADGSRGPVVHEDDDPMNPEVAPVHFPKLIQQSALYKRSPEFRQIMHEGYYGTHIEKYKSDHFARTGEKAPAEWQRMYGVEPNEFQRERKQQGAKLGDPEGMTHPNSKHFPRGLYKLATHTAREVNEGNISLWQGLNVIFTGKTPNANRGRRGGGRTPKNTSENMPSSTGQMIRMTQPKTTNESGETQYRLTGPSGTNPGSIEMSNEGRLWHQSAEHDLMSRGINRIVGHLREARAAGKKEFASNARFSTKRLAEFDTNPLAGLDQPKLNEQWSRGTAPRTYADSSVTVSGSPAIHSPAEKHSGNIERTFGSTGKPGSEGSLVLGGQPVVQFRQGATQQMQQFLDQTGVTNKAREQGKIYRTQMSEETSRAAKGKIAARLRMNAPKSE